MMLYKIRLEMKKKNTRYYLLFQIKETLVSITRY